MIVPSVVKAGAGMMALAAAVVVGVAVRPSPDASIAAQRVGEEKVEVAKSGGPSNPQVVEARRKLDQALRANQPEAAPAEPTAPAPTTMASASAPVSAPPSSPAPAAAEPQPLPRQALALAPVAASVDGGQTAITRSVGAQRPLAPPTAVSPAPAATPVAAIGGEADELCDRAKRELSDGAVASARLLLTRAARAGGARPLHMLAETYDPAALKEQGLRAAGDMAKARALYAQAVAAGSNESARRLAALPK